MKEKEIYNNLKKRHDIILPEEEQDNTSTESPDDTKTLDFRTPQNVKDNIETTKKSKQTITLT